MSWSAHLEDQHQHGRSGTTGPTCPELPQHSPEGSKETKLAMNREVLEACHTQLPSCIDLALCGAPALHDLLVGGAWRIPLIVLAVTISSNFLMLRHSLSLGSWSILGHEQCWGTSFFPPPVAYDLRALWRLYGSVPNLWHNPCPACWILS